jgi:hypothetical protein
VSSRFPYGEENVVESPLCSRELCQQYLLPGKAHKCEKFVTFRRLAERGKPDLFSFLFAETRVEILKTAFFCRPRPRRERKSELSPGRAFWVPMAQDNQ